MEVELEELEGVVGKVLGGGATTAGPAATEGAGVEGWAEEAVDEELEAAGVEGNVAGGGALTAGPAATEGAGAAG